MASTDKLAPRIVINEHDVLPKDDSQNVHPISLMFGFAPIGRTCEMVTCRTPLDVTREFGQPVSAPEKFFIDSALRIVQTGATVLMTRLPYDNEQSHTVKYVDYSLQPPISIGDIATVPSETMTRQRDDAAVTILKEMHDLDHRMTQVQRISQVSDDYGDHIKSMTNEELVELELDPQSNLPSDTFRIVDIRGEQYGTGAQNLDYCGIFPIITTSPMALYMQNLIQNTTEMDAKMGLVDIDAGVDMSNEWHKTADPTDDEVKMTQAEIMAGVQNKINFDSTTNRWHRGGSFQDVCVGRFPKIATLQPGKLEQKHIGEIGVLVCAIGWDADLQTTTLSVLEAFHGPLGRTRNGVDKAINSQSRYIRMYKNVNIPQETDFFVADGQQITSIGMDPLECVKWINYKTSIIDPVQFVLDSIYSDVDSIQVDAILDAGLSSTAFAAYTASNSSSGETFKDNDEIRTRVDWSRGEYPMDDYVEDYSYVWGQVTQMFGEFCKNVRGDCVYIADGPRILNLERNYPIANYTDVENVEMFNKYLPLFNGYTNNYVSRYWNWVYIEDMQYANRGFWVPGSVVIGSQLAVNDMNGRVWYAPAGQTRGLVGSAYNVSVRTKQYNEENDMLYQNQWNFFSIYQNEGVVVEGQKTMQTKKTALDRLNVRRMVCWMKQQLRAIANRYKYEPNTQSQREGFVGEVAKMLQDVQRSDGISDYRIVCDDTNNSVSTIDRHELWCKIAIKPIRSIEYILIDIDILNSKVGIGESAVVYSGN